MAWNEPGGDKKPDNPFGSGGNKPPDLDKIMSDFINKIKGALGMGGSGGQSGGSAGPALFILIFLGIAVLWSSMYRLDEPERGVVLLFGKYHRTLNPGLNFTWPRPFATVHRVNVTKVRQENNSKEIMLTSDKNLVEINYSIQYRVSEARVRDFLFKLENPQNTVRQAAESAMRQVAGTSTLDHIINENRIDVMLSVRNELQSMLDDYQSGIEVLQVNITEVHPPNRVKEAFNDVVKAREDQKTYINQANEYAKGKIPEAEGRVLKIIQDAEAYYESVLARARGESKRFDLLRSEYEMAPQVTRQRLYLESMERILSNTNKVVVDSEAGNSMMYLPLDQLLKNSHRNNQPIDLGTTYVIPETNSPSTDANARRGRQGRGN